MTVKQRLVALVALAVFVAITLGSAPWVVASFRSADLSAIDGGGVSFERVATATQLYAVLCVTALVPAFLWSAWLRRFGGPLQVVGLGSRGGPGPSEALGGLRSRTSPSASVAPVLVDWLRGAGAGGLLIALLFGLLAGAGWYRVGIEGWEPGLLATVFAALMLAALYEELLFRGFGYWAMAGLGGPALAIVVSSLLFALAHSDNQGSSWLGLVNTALAGALLGVLRWRSGSLWLAWGVHLGWNASLGLLFGMPTSGTAFAGRVLHSEVTASGARHLALSGGDYGPEGSLLLTPMLVVWIGWLLWQSAVRLRRE